MAVLARSRLGTEKITPRSGGRCRGSLRKSERVIKQGNNLALRCYSTGTIIGRVFRSCVSWVTLHHSILIVCLCVTCRGFGFVCDLLHLFLV